LNEKSDKFQAFWGKLKKIVDIIMDVILYPLIFLSLITSVVSITARDNTEVRGVFGYSIVSILTGSMRAGGFEPGDIVFLKETKPEDLRPKSEFHEGDIIAFYQLYDPGDPSRYQMTKITDFDNLPQPTTTEKVTGNKTRQEAIDNKDVVVIFHRIIAVYMAEDGTYFFETKGDSNNSADNLIREDFLVGRYIEVAAFITNSLRYMVTPDGMFWIIIVPLSIIVFLQIVELMTILFDMATEKKVLEGAIPFDCEESVKARVGREMDLHNKIYLYDITPPVDKPRMKAFLWEGIFESPDPETAARLSIKKLSAKDKQAREKELKNKHKIEEGVNLYNVSRDQYWNYWIENAPTSISRKKMIVLRRNANIIVKAREVGKKK
jgi:signal peptidase I